MSDLTRNEPANGVGAGNSSVFQKFCGEDDTIKAGKACENCTCGKKE